VSEFDSTLRTIESERELNFRIYQSISESIESGNAQRIRAVRALVDALASDELKQGFLSALDSGEVQIFVAEEAATPRARDAAPPRPGSAGAGASVWGDWDFDVFWCSRSGAGAESQAKAIVDAVKAQGARGRIRDRVLPESIRQQGTYAELQPYEVRYEDGEAAQARAVQAVAAKALGGTPVALKEITPKTATPWYVSVFVCPEPSAPAS